MRSGLMTGPWFQSTRPHGARHWGWRGSRCSGRFNPRARTGRDDAIYEALRICNVSIHAPARGATLLALLERSHILGFNPRARTGRDIGLAAGCRRTGVSIHAPARGATRWHASFTCHCGVFQSTRPHGARRSTDPNRVTKREFQSTRPHGARHADANAFVEEAGFNPRARTGRDLDDVANWEVPQCFNPRARTGRDLRLVVGAFQHLAVSIHAPARGATSSQLGTHRLTTCFNPRARTGRDSWRRAGMRSVRGFNPRARTGRDFAAYEHETDAQQFQSTRPHGARPSKHGGPEHDCCVSIHAPARGATGYL